MREAIKHSGVIDPIQPVGIGFPKKLSYGPMLVVLLIVASFFLGMLTDKVNYLSANGASPKYGIQQAQVPNQPNQPNQPQAPVAGQKQNVDIGHLPAKGDKNAKVTIIEFADLRCPFCEKLFTDTEPQLLKDYVNTGKAVLYFRHYAFLGPASVVAANAAECANEQGKFWDMHDYLYKNQPSESDTSLFTTDKLTQVAGTLGMDTNQFNSCLSANKYAKNVSDDLAAGQKATVNGTPTIFIDGIPVVGAQPYTAFQTIIDQELAKK